MPNARRQLALGRILSLIFAALVLVPWFIPALPQPQDYHGFADQRPFWGLENFWLVTSNLAFIIVGLYGLMHWLQKRSHFDTMLHQVLWLLFVVGVIAVGFGSWYYHMAPENFGLMLDRLPMALSFAAMTAFILSERIDFFARHFILTPFLNVYGVWTVIYWYWTETLGRGNLWPYLGVQYGTMLMTLLALLFLPHKNDRHLWKGLILYVAAKVVEGKDVAVYDLTHQIICGHTLKHFLAAWTIYYILRYAFDPKPSPAV